MEQAIFQEELARADAPQLIGTIGLSLVGPTIIADGHRRAEDALSADDSLRRRDLVSGIFRAERRQRPRRAGNEGHSRRRRLHHQRPENLDQLRADGRLVSAAGAHGFGSAEAQRHHLPAGGHEQRRRVGAAAEADVWRLGIQRSVLFERARARRRKYSAKSTKAGPRPSPP